MQCKLVVWRGGGSRYFTTVLVALRLKPCFDATWSCLLSLTAVWGFNIDVITKPASTTSNFKCVYIGTNGKAKEKE